jgi:hypothetical protein
MTQPNTHDGDTFELISTYTDAEAVEDGNLIEINDKDRATRAVWDFALNTVPEGLWPPRENAKPASEPDAEAVVAQRVLDMCRHIVEDYGPEATRVYRENVGGGIWKGKLLVVGKKIVALAPWPASEDWPEETGNVDLWHRSLWLLPNEIGGMTLMLTEDY